MLASTIAKLRYLHYALAAILHAFKLIAEGGLSIPPLVSVGVIVAAIVIAVWQSFRAERGARCGNKLRLRSPPRSIEAIRNPSDVE